VNEITAITDTAGPAWVTPAYDKAGNMTRIPRPDDPTKSFTGTYDPWNRETLLVDADTSNTVDEAEYDGRTFRTLLRTYDAGELAEIRHFYDTIGWQCVEERTQTDGLPSSSTSSTSSINPAVPDRQL
jgi:YD repeat-containing protein